MVKQIKLAFGLGSTIDWSYPLTIRSGMILPMLA